MNKQDLQTINERAIADGMVKVGIPCTVPSGIAREWCWAKRISPSFARLDNCCIFCDGVGFGDVVEFRERDDDDGGPSELLKQFVRVVTRGSTQRDIVYATIDEVRDKSDQMIQELTNRYRDIQRFCDGMVGDVRPIHVEGFSIGLLCAAFPPSVSEERADELLANCPHRIEP